MNILNSYTPESGIPVQDLQDLYSSENTLLFILRHGQIEGHATKRFIGQTDICLDDQGKDQALKWHKVFGSIQFNAVYSSSLKRCLNTARLVCPHHGIHTDHRLNEINMGTWDGKTFAEIKQDRPDEFNKRGSQIYQFRPDNGESFKDLSKRILSFFNEIVEEETKLKIKHLQNSADKPQIKNKSNVPGSRILAVTHAGVIRVLLCHIMEMNPEDLFKIKLDYGHLSVLKI